MNEDFWLVLTVAAVWALLAAVYALAPWGDMIGYARVWGFGSLLFLALAALLFQHRPRHRPKEDTP
ncbi:MAG: hypothetical protein FJX60_00285 [Alphaproteobacteria bacterium]|nr:hypothetical protein [Alphaproteobacteria bacterium]